MSRPPGIRETRFDEPEHTITREQYHRLNGGPVAIVENPAPPAEHDSRTALVGCAGCDVIFEQKREGQRFHSPGCAGKWHSEQRRGRPKPQKSRKTKSQPTLVAVPELPTEPAAALEVPAEAVHPGDTAAAELRAILASLARQAIGAADAWHLEAWLGPGATLTLRKEAT